MTKEIKIKNKVVLITGGYGHLGKSITESLALHGGKVYVLGRSEEKFSNAFGDGGSNANIEFHQCDIGEENSVKNAAEIICNSEGRIDALVNNAFYIRGKDPENMDNSDWEYGIDGNLNCVFRAIKETLPFLKLSEHGRIVNVASMYGMISPDFDVYNDFPNFLNPPHYGAAKAGVIQLTKYYAGYLGKYNITVNSVSPGPFPSTPVQKGYPEFIDVLASKTALNRIGQPDEVAGIFTFLISEASNYITGQNFAVDGGWTIKS